MHNFILFRLLTDHRSCFSSRITLLFFFPGSYHQDSKGYSEHDATVAIIISNCVSVSLLLKGWVGAWRMAVIRVTVISLIQQLQKNFTSVAMISALSAMRAKSSTVEVKVAL